MGDAGTRRHAPMPTCAGCRPPRFAWARIITTPRKRRRTSSRVDGFWMDRYTVTNREFERFVDATGYVTLAERPVDPALYPGAQARAARAVVGRLREAGRAGGSAQRLQLVDYVAGADWRHPRGPAELAAGPVGPPRRACRVRGRRRLCEMGRQRAADRSGVGARRARRSRRRRVRLGRRVHAERPAAGEHLAGRVSVAEPAARTATNGRRPSARFRRTATVSTRWPATSGSGRPTGTGAHHEGANRRAARPTNPRGGKLEDSFDPRAAGSRFRAKS